MRISTFILCLFISVHFITAQQVGINTNDPNPLTVLDVTNVYDGNGNLVPRGMMVPRLTEAERDLIDVSDPSQANSLLIYNTDEDCFNYFSRTENMWKSICGGTSSTANIAEVYCDDLNIEGIYQTGSPLNSADFLQIPINVVKPGNYEISAISNPPNGYFYSLSGTFLTTGIITLTVPGYGTPISEQTDSVIVSINGVAYCGKNVDVLSDDDIPVFDISCSGITVQGDYVAGRALSSLNNTILVTLTTTSQYFGTTYKITTDTVNGYYFNAEGIISQSTQTIALNGFGTPTTSGTNTFRITTNSGGTFDVDTGCDFEVKIATRSMTILGVGENNIYYLGANSNGMYRVLNNANLFGLSQTAVFPVAGMNIVQVGIGNDKNFATLIPQYNPDVIIIQYNWTGGAYGASNLQVLTDYVNAGGVLILCSDGGDVNGGRNVRSRDIVNSIFDNPGTVIMNTGTTTENSQIMAAAEQSSAPVLNGPFSDLHGEYMSRDAQANFNFDVNTLPATAGVISYTDATYVNARAFMHLSKGFLFIGDGAPFAYASGNTEPTNYPMKLDASYNPIPNNYVTPGPSYNAHLFCNIMAWAFQWAQENKQVVGR